MALNARQRRLIDALLTHPTRIEACKAAGVGKSSLLRWEQEPEFANALQDAQQRLFGDGFARLLASQDNNLAELQRLALEAESEHVRLRAALGWEAALVKRYELLTLADLAQRVEALEAKQL